MEVMRGRDEVDIVVEKAKQRGIERFTYLCIVISDQEMARKKENNIFF